QRNANSSLMWSRVRHPQFASLRESKPSFPRRVLHRPTPPTNTTSYNVPTTTEGHLSVGLYLLARFNQPQNDPDAVLQRIETFIKQFCADLAPEISTGMRDTSPTLFCGLHPAAEDVEISLLDARHITASANTAIGVGYHILLCKLLKSLESPFDLQW